MHNQNADQHHFKLFVSTDSQVCKAVQTYLEKWAKYHGAIKLDTIPILDEPRQLIHLGVNHTPALVVNGAIVMEPCSVAKLQKFLEDFS